MSSLEVNYNDVTLQVEGNYYQGEERAFDYPGSGSEFELQYVYAGSKTDIYDILTNKQIEDIEKLCIEELDGIEPLDEKLLNL